MEIYSSYYKIFSSYVKTFGIHTFPGIKSLRYATFWLIFFEKQINSQAPSHSIFVKFFYWNWSRKFTCSWSFSGFSVGFWSLWDISNSQLRCVLRCSSFPEMIKTAIFLGFPQFRRILLLEWSEGILFSFFLLQICGSFFSILASCLVYWTLRLSEVMLCVCSSICFFIISERLISCNCFGVYM